MRARPINGVQTLGHHKQHMAWCLVGLCLLCSGLTASAQLLRLGSVEFNSTAGVQGIYSSNVDNVRPSHSIKEREDYYTELSLTLTGQRKIMRSSTINLDTGLTMERHLRRSDLDTTSDPFGHGRLSSDIELGRSVIGLSASHDRTYVKPPDTFVSSARSERDVYDRDMLGSTYAWSWQKLSLGANYDLARERHQSDVFKDADSDTTSMGMVAGWEVAERWRVAYSHTRSKNEFTGKTNEIAVSTALASRSADWTESQVAGLTYLFLERPHLTYSLAMEKRRFQEESSTWHPTHTFNASDTIELSKNLRISGVATYKIDKQSLSDQMTFTYTAHVDHDINRTTHQSISMTREPANTFGSNAKTDSTTYDYMLNKAELFIKGLSLGVGANYSVNQAMGETGSSAESEKNWTYHFNLNHNRSITRKINETISYSYTRANSSAEPEILDEHRVTIGYRYTF